MRWLPFLILSYLSVCVQFALGGALRWGEATPNLVMLLVVFVGLHAPLRTALSAAFVAGLMHDVIAGHGLGTYVVGYAIVVALASQLRDVMYPDHAVTHVAVAFVGGVALATYLEVRHGVRSCFFADEPPIAFGRRLLAALASAALAIPVIWLLRRMRRMFAFSSR